MRLEWPRRAPAGYNRDWAAGTGRPAIFDLLKQVHVRGTVCRGLRLELVAGLGFALATSALTVAQAQGVNTTTALTQQAGATAACPTANLKVALTDLTVAVTGNTGVPTGIVSIVDGTGDTAVQLASATLDATGQASFVLYLSDGAHSLSAVYAGNADFATSTSAPVSLTISSQCDSTFVVTAANLTPAASSASTLGLTAGQSGAATITVTPAEAFVSSLTGPAFITISCSGLPDQATCGFTPQTVQVLPGQDGGVTSSMLILTYAASANSNPPANRPGGNATPIAWAFLLPGALGLGGLAWGARRRWLSRLSLLSAMALVTALGTTGCNPRYNYEHHGPLPNPGTPAGTYTVNIAGQYSNGVTATTHSTSFTLTVK